MALIARLLIILWAMASAMPASAGQFDRFAGRWAGWGQLGLSNGSVERMKCVTTYKVKNGGAGATQNFRCNSASYRFDAVVDYKASGGKLSGTWRERIYSIGGKVTGAYTRNSLRFIARSETFLSRVKISTSQCSQAIDIRPRDIEVTSISVSVKRC